MFSTVSLWKLSTLNSYCKEMQHIHINLGTQSVRSFTVDQITFDCVFRCLCLLSFPNQKAQTFATVSFSISVVSEYKLMFSVYKHTLFFCGSLQPFYLWCRSDVKLSYLVVVTDDALLPNLLTQEFMLYDSNGR